MKRAGFTMIELIFVIVILGILAAVALPKFIGVSTQAHDQKVEAFAGTLNRTVGPALWAASIAAGDDGAIDCTVADVITAQVDIPDELTQDNATCDFSIVAAGGATLRIDMNASTGTQTISPQWIVTTE